MHRVAFIIFVVLGFLIAHQVVNLIAHRSVIFGKTGILLLAVVSLEVQVNWMRCILPRCLVRPEN